MNRFDVVLLLLSTAASERFDLFLSLYGALTRAGFHTSFATHPIDLRKPNTRLRVVVVDGNEHAQDLDPLLVTRQLCDQHTLHQRIIYVAGTTLGALNQGWKTGADMVVRENVQGAVLCDLISHLVRSPYQRTILRKRSISEHVREP